MHRYFLRGICVSYFVRLATCLLSFCLYVCSSFCLFVYRLLFVFQFVRLFVCPSTFCLFVCPSFCLSVFLFACNNFLFTENVWHTRWRAHRQNANKPEKSSFSLLRLPFHSLQVLSFCHYMDLLEISRRSKHEKKTKSYRNHATSMIT